MHFFCLFESTNISLTVWINKGENKTFKFFVYTVVLNMPWWWRCRHHTFHHLFSPYKLAHLSLSLCWRNKNIISPRKNHNSTCGVCVRIHVFFLFPFLHYMQAKVVSQQHGCCCCCCVWPSAQSLSFSLHPQINPQSKHFYSYSVLIIQLEISPIPHEHTHNNGQQPTHFLELLFYFFHWKKVETMLI